MNDHIVSLLIGISSGIVTSIFLLLFAEFVKRVVVPWYRSIIYRGVDISGQWNHIMELTQNTQLLHMSLKQKANVVIGDIVIVKKYPDGKDIVETMRLKGSISDRILSAEISFSDLQRFGHANLLMEVVADGRTMIGVTSWYDSGLAKILSQDTLCQRVMQKETFDVKGKNESGDEHARNES